jgi:glycine/D-amino acid oxidase-like deaminating enzyme
MDVDYIIVGLGIAGLSFCEQLEQQGKCYLVFNDSSQSATKTAAGIINPTNLKRFTAVWNAAQFMASTPQFYIEIEARIASTVYTNTPIYRRFASIEEQNDWVVASDTPALSPYLSTKFVNNNNPAFTAPFGMGEILQAARVDTHVLLQGYESYLNTKGKLRNTSFDYSQCILDGDNVTYQDVRATHIVFCEGFGVIQNPFFKYLPVPGNKGEYILIKAPELQLEGILKASLFIVPLGNDCYKIGATFNREDKLKGSTVDAKEILIEKVDALLKTNYELIDQVAGVRPTTGDRRPLLGRHPEHKNLAILNGFGSRGLMMAASLSSQLLDHLENGNILATEVDIKRFEKRYHKSKKR